MLLAMPPASPLQKFQPEIKRTKAFLDLVMNATDPLERVGLVQTHDEEFMCCLSLLFLDPVVELAFNRVSVTLLLTRYFIYCHVISFCHVNIIKYIYAMLSMLCIRPYSIALWIST